MLSITPQELSTIASAWIGAFVIIALAAGAAALKLMPMLAIIKERLKGLDEKHDDTTERLNVQSARITAQDTKLTTVALATPKE